MPPMPEPNHASDVASAGTERAPPVSAAMALSATTPIHAAPKEMPRITSERLATIQEVRVSMLGVIFLRRHPESRRRRLSGIHNHEIVRIAQFEFMDPGSRPAGPGRDDTSTFRRKTERLLEARRIARPNFPVEHALDRLAVERRDHLLGCEAPHVLARLSGHACG